MGHLDLKTDGPTVVEAPPQMLGFCRTGCSATSWTSARWGRTRARAESTSFCRPATRAGARGLFRRQVADLLGDLRVRGFKVDGKTDQAVALMKQIKVYPLAKAASRRRWSSSTARGKAIDTMFPDNFRFFELLAQLVERGAGGESSRRWSASRCRPSASRRASRSTPTRRPRRCSRRRRGRRAMARANTYASRVAGRLLLGPQVAVRVRTGCPTRS